MTNGYLCWCSGVVSPATLVDDTSCNLDCTDDPVGNKRTCGGGGNFFSIWKLGKEYCPFKSKFSKRYFNIGISNKDIQKCPEIRGCSAYPSEVEHAVLV